MKSKSIIILSVGLLFFSTKANSQDLQTGFFLDNYAFSHRINPALQASRGDIRGYFGVGVDNITVSAHSNVGLNNFLFPTDDGKLVIGLDDYVSDEEFLSGLSAVNSFQLGVNENLFSIGGKGKRGLFFNIEANIKSGNSVNVSKDVFKLLKQGGNLSDMQFSDFSAGSDNYLEAALGFGKKCGNLSVGFKVKALVGLVGAKASVNELSIKLIDNGISANGKGDISVAAAPIEFLTPDGHLKSPSFKGVETSGMGVAFDLGVVYDVTDNLEISASVNDLGVFNWNCETKGQLEVEYSDGLNLKVQGNEPGAEHNMLPLIANAGIRYNFNKVVSIGALASAKTGKNIFFEGRGGLTITPGSVISLAVSGGANTFGPVYGAALNLCLGPVNLFAGLDQVITTFTPQWIPVGKVNTNAALGLLIVL